MQKQVAKRRGVPRIAREEEVVAGNEHGITERNPLDVIPVRMGQQNGGTTGAARKACVEERFPPPVQSGPRVKNKFVLVGCLNGDARGVGPVLTVVAGRSGNTTPRAPEFDQHNLLSLIGQLPAFHAPQVLRFPRALVPDR